MPSKQSNAELRKERMGVSNNPSGLVIQNIAMRELLRRWLKKHAPHCKPGAWEYDHDAAELCQTTATLLGIEDPWRGL